MPAAGAVAEPEVVAGEAVSEAGTLTLVLTSYIGKKGLASVIHVIDEDKQAAHLRGDIGSRQNRTEDEVNEEVLLEARVSTGAIELRLGQPQHATGHVAGVEASAKHADPDAGAGYVAAAQ